MNILMVLEANYPADIRVQKEYKTLIEAGHNVYLLCIHKKGQAYAEESDGLRVIRISVGESKYMLAFWDVVNSINFCHPVFAKHITKAVAQHKIDIVHIHDLPLAGTALKLKKKLKVKVVLDLHENYPEALKVWHTWKKNPIARLKNKLFLNYKKWIKYEAIAAHSSDHIICVVNEMKQRLVAQHDVQERKITVVTNTEELSFLKQPLNENIYGDLKDRFIIAYTGGVGPHRGVDTLIKGMVELKKHDDIIVVIAGSGSNSVMSYLNLLIKKYSLDKKVFLWGYQPFSNFHSLMKFSTVNAIPHHSNGHTDNTIPHKLFQGMMVGRPLIVSSSTAIKRTVEEVESGLIFEAGDVDDYVEKIERLYQEDNLRQRLAENGLNATLHGKYKWEETGKALKNMYDALI